MKRIKAYKKLFEVEKDLDLKYLKKKYRNLVKEWHPDKYQAGDPKLIEAEDKSREIIDGYHFLVSIAPETIAANLDTYTETITKSAIADYQHKGMLLEVTFTDGATYEYFGVSKKVYIKLVNASNLNRFARRTIFSNYTYRKSKRILEAV
ncbi:KTSC domain-containing protein [uncultured Algibacter sp.]|uniref:KTSC domain-containing protein n=1 Tax=uncultured Algibacter sp. TaxID=298659 RepID=UPI0032172833